MKFIFFCKDIVISDCICNFAVPFEGIMVQNSSLAQLVRASDC